MSDREFTAAVKEQAATMSVPVTTNKSVTRNPDLLCLNRRRKPSLSESNYIR